MEVLCVAGSVNIGLHWILSAMISPRTRFPRGRVVFIDLALLQLPADYVSMTLYPNLTVPTKHVWQINFGKYVDNPR